MKKLSLWLLIVLISLGAFFTAKAATPDTDIVTKLYSQIINWSVIKRMTCTNKDQIITTIVNNVKLNLVTSDKDTRLANIKSLLQTKLQDYATTKCSQKWSNLIGSSSIKALGTTSTKTISITCDPTKATKTDQTKLNMLISQKIILPWSTFGKLILGNLNNTSINISKSTNGWFIARPVGSYGLEWSCYCAPVMTAWKCDTSFTTKPDWWFQVTCAPNAENPCEGSCDMDIKVPSGNAY
jgi:hypothetical protein